MMESTSVPLISAPVRYAAAWGEINTRLSVRSNFNVYHVASIIALAAAHFSIPTTDINLRLVPAIFIPVVSFIFVMWYRHNDYIIASLSAYCSTFESVDFKNGCEFAPWFYTPQGGKSIQTYVLDFREWSDLATIVICGVSPALILIDVLWQIIYGNIPIPAVIALYTGLLVCVAGSAWLIILMRRVPEGRKDILTKSAYDPKIGLWSLPTIK